MKPLLCIKEKAGRLEIDSGLLQMKFGIKNSFRIEKLSFKKGINFFSKAKRYSIWEIEIQHPQFGKKIISSQKALFENYSIGKQSNNSKKIILQWKLVLPNNQFGSVLMPVRFTAGDNLSRWNLKIQLPPKWQLIRTEFPILPNIKLREKLKLAVPYGWGLEYVLKPGDEYNVTYPSCRAGMQFVTFYAHKDGFYIGAHDYNASHKDFHINSGKKDIRFSLTYWENIKSNSKGKYQIPYDMVLGAYQGNYYDGAQIYRKFTMKTKWGNIPNLSKRRKIPVWLKNNVLWLRPRGNPQENLAITLKALKYFNVPTICHWYNWHKIPFDTLYPEYFPSVPGFKQAIKKIQQAGSHVMPYINGRLFDPAAKSWEKDKAYKIAAIDHNGKFYTEIYPSKVPLNVICPYTKKWQEIIYQLIYRLINQIGVDGVYIDQISAAPPVLCHNPAHGHFIGGGDFWYYGYRKMMNKIREKLPPNIILTTEENAEPWVDQFDAQLVLNTFTSEHKIIPLYPAVYSGRVLSFGFLYFKNDDLLRSLPFRFKMANCFIYGSQLGWIAPQEIMLPEYQDEADYLKNLVMVRQYGHAYATNGQFLGLLDIGGNNPIIKGFGTRSFGPGDYPIELHSVVGSIWKSEKGNMGILLTNHTDKEYAIKFRIPLEKIGWNKSSSILIKVIGSDGLKKKYSLNTHIIKITIPARDANIIEMKIVP